MPAGPVGHQEKALPGSGGESGIRLGRRLGRSVRSMRRSSSRASEVRASASTGKYRDRSRSFRLSLVPTRGRCQAAVDQGILSPLRPVVFFSTSSSAIENRADHESGRDRCRTGERRDQGILPETPRARAQSARSPYRSRRSWSALLSFESINRVYRTVFHSDQAEYSGRYCMPGYSCYAGQAQVCSRKYRQHVETIVVPPRALLSAGILDRGCSDSLARSIRKLTSQDEARPFSRATSGLLSKCHCLGRLASMAMKIAHHVICAGETVLVVENSRDTDGRAVRGFHGFAGTAERRVKLACHLLEACSNPQRQRRAQEPGRKAQGAHD